MISYWNSGLGSTATLWLFFVELAIRSVVASVSVGLVVYLLAKRVSWRLDKPETESSMQEVESKLNWYQEALKQHKE